MKEQIKLVERIVRSAFPQLSKPQQKVMAQIINAIPDANSFTLRDIASGLPGETDVKHKLKKLQYFLDRLRSDREFWKSYISFILCLPNLKLSKRENISIVINTVNLGPSFSLMTADISYRNRPLPLFLKLWNTCEIPVDFKNEVNTMIKLLKELLPEKYSYLFISDNNSMKHDLIESFVNQDSEYIVRIRPKMLKLKDADNYTPVQLFPDGIYHEANTKEFGSEANTNIAVISMTGEENSRSGMYFATNLTNKDKVLRNYTRRMLFEEDIEYLIIKLKWYKYSKIIPELSRFEKLLIISCLCYALRSSEAENFDKDLQHIIVNLTRMK